MTVSATVSRPSYARAKRPIDPALPRHESLVHMLHAAVVAQPDLPAVISLERQITYAEFGRAVAGLARDLKVRRVGRGERVILLMPNSIEMDVAIMGVMAAGAQVAPANPFFTVAELTKLLKDVDASLVICDPSVADKAVAVAAALGIPCVALGPSAAAPSSGSTLERLDVGQWTRDPGLALDPRALPRADDLALIIFTGGSTGVPKGVDHTHRGLLYGVLQHCTVWPKRFGRERFLNVAPMFHIWGLAYAAWVPIFAQSTLVLLPRYEPDKVVQALGDYRITDFSGGPAPIYMGLMASPLFERVDLAELVHCPSGGAPVPADLHREWLAKTGRPLLEGWGMSEGAPFCLNPDPGKRKLMSVGNPVPETELEVVDVETGERVLPLGERGEVRVRGPQLMVGYRNRPDETALALRDGWMYTGDIGYLDDEGFLFLVDRKKDMVIVGGYNVYPREVDEVLFNHPKIRAAATVGKSDARLGEALVAFVVLVDGATMTEDEFFAYCKEQMVKYKRPVEVRFVDALPKTGTNKIDRPALRELLKR